MALHPEFPYPIYLVITESACRYHHWLEVAEQAILGGVDIVQLREKELSVDELLKRAIQLKSLTDTYNIPLVINDFPDIAAHIDAWGVHVGQNDTSPSRIARQYASPPKIGWSLENMDQLVSSEISGVHHLGVSPIYHTPTKTDTSGAWGLHGLKQLRAATDRPLIAIGGLHVEHVQSVFENGADSVAVVSEICSSLNPKKAAEQLKNCWVQHDKKSN